jgi:LPS export ABC transporter protein LptC
MNVRNFLGILLLSIFAVGSWYLARSLQPGAKTAAREELLHSGFYVKSARILGTNAAGRLMYEIEADYAEQQENDDVAFENVEIHYTSEAEVPWTLNADRAVIGNKRDYVTLSGHVVATSRQGFAGRVTEIRTQYLELEPDSFRAHTEERVQIRIGARSLTATGMLAMLQSSQLQLKSDVSGKFAP